MTKFINQFLILCACMLAFSSCEKNTIDIPLSSVTIELDDIVVDDGSHSKSTMNPFSFTQTISSATIKGLTDDAKKYKSRIQSMSADTVFITITTTDGVGTVVENFTLKAEDLFTYPIPQYHLGTAYTDSQLTDYAVQLLKKIMTDDSVNISILGETDVPSGDHLKITITMKDVVMAAKIIN